MLLNFILITQTKPKQPTTQEQIEAAERIQAGFRGYQTRHEIAMKKEQQVLQNC